MTLTGEIWVTLDTKEPVLYSVHDLLVSRGTFLPSEHIYTESR